MAATVALGRARAGGGRGGGLRALGTTLFIVGIMFTFIGLLLRGLCLIAGGILCSGTSIGEIGWSFVLPGIPLLVLGFVLLRAGRKAMERARAEAGEAPLLSRVLAAEVATENRAFAFSSAAPQAGPVPSNCPTCGGPVQRGALECEWCGQTFV